MAAGIVIMREAGGIVSDVAGGAEMFATGSIVAGNTPIQRSLLAVLGAAAA
jgi:myo-inositol-1(or 4)-monophosphatase